MTYLQTIDRYGKILIAYQDCLSERTREIISLQNYSVDIDDILELRAEKLIDDEDVLLLLEHNNIQDFLSEYRLSMSDLDISDDTRKRLFNLCLNTRSYTSLSPIMFSDALKLNGKIHIEITEKGFIRCDERLYTLLHDLNADMIIITEDGEERPCSYDDLKEYVADCCDKYYIMPVDLMSTLLVAELAGEMYVEDFVQYCNQNHIATDRRIHNEYVDYVQKIKLSYTLRLYRPYRHICGKVNNIIDYRNQNGFTSEIELPIDNKDRQPDSLLKDVLSKYIRNNFVLENDVIEVLNDRQTYHFVYLRNDDEFVCVQIANFTIPLFDENKMWDIIRSFQGQIKTDGDSVIIPDALLLQVNDVEAEAIKNILRQQQQSYKKMSTETNKQKLTAILDKAREELNQKEKVAEQKAADKAKRNTNNPVDE